ncbi:MAG TPA: anti-sigma factor [Thermomicrobiaceae bacterium]|nr:anti-sigma factor [Thermomicrobiaceae bacterium]
MDRRTLTHEEVLAELPSYLLDDLDPAMLAAVETHLAGCPRCQAEHDRLARVLGALGTLAPEAAPPAALRQRVLDALDADTTPAPRPATPARAGRLTRWPERARWAMAAAAAVILLLAGTSGFLYHDLSRTRDQLSATQRREDDAREVLTKPSASIALVADSAKDAYGTLYIGETGHDGMMVVEQLPPTPANQLYQVWLIQNGQRTSAALFTVGQDGLAQVMIESTQPLTAYQSLGITLEPAPHGSPGPTGPRIASCRLSPRPG